MSIVPITISHYFIDSMDEPVEFSLFSQISRPRVKAHTENPYWASINILLFFITLQSTLINYCESPPTSIIMSVLVSHDNDRTKAPIYIRYFLLTLSCNSSEAEFLVTLGSKGAKQKNNISIFPIPLVLGVGQKEGEREREEKVYVVCRP